MLLHKHSLLIDLFDKNFFLFPLSFLSIKQIRCKWSVIPVYYRLHPVQLSSTCMCVYVVFIEEVNGAKLQETLNLSSTFEPGNPAFLRPNFSFYLSFLFDVVPIVNRQRIQDICTWNTNSLKQILLNLFLILSLYSIFYCFLPFFLSLCVVIHRSVVHMKVYIHLALAFEYTHKNCNKNIKNTKKLVAPTYKFNIIFIA